MIGKELKHRQLDLGIATIIHLLQKTAERRFLDPLNNKKKRQPAHEHNLKLCNRSSIAGHHTQNGNRIKGASS